LKSCRRSILALLLALLVGPAPGVWGAAPAKPEAQADQSEFPLRITAARLEADQNGGLIVFSGNVKADYGDSTLYSDQLRVFYKPKPETPKGKAAAPAPQEENQGPLGDLGGEKIDRIVATGQVRFVQEDRVATGEQATFYKDRDEVVLTGNPQLWRAENTLKGERIIFNIKTNKMLVESSPQKRVEALLYSQTTAGGKESKDVLPLKPKARKSAPR
jgi:lipopolysaccharide export system protein LptA